MKCTLVVKVIKKSEKKRLTPKMSLFKGVTAKEENSVKSTL